MEEFMFMGLRKIEGISKNNLKKDLIKIYMMFMESNK